MAYCDGGRAQGAGWEGILARAKRAEERVAELEQKFAVGRAKKAVANAKVFRCVRSSVMVRWWWCIGRVRWIY